MRTDRRVSSRNRPGERHWRRWARGVCLIGLALLAFTELDAATEAHAGGTWMSLQCFSDTRQDAPDAEYESNAAQHFMNFQWCGTSNDPPAMIVTLPGNPSIGDYAEYHFDAPTGSVINRVQQWAWMNGDSAGTVRPDLFYRAPGVGDVAYASGNAPFWAFYDTGDITASRVGGALSCVVAGCSATFVTAMDQSDIFITLNDTSPPATPSVSGSLISQPWVRGSRDLSMSASDQGSGVALLAIAVNGQVLTSHDPCDEQYVPGTTMSRRLQPCASNATHAFEGIDTSHGPFQEGANVVASCVAEYGSDPAISCDERTVNVDNVAPSAPEGLVVAGGSGWRPTNDFDVSWDNPPADSFAPPDGAVYELVNSQGQVVEGPTTVGEGGVVRSIDDIEVPSPGQYTLHVHLRDAAGNESEDSAVVLRFDPSVPSRPDTGIQNGWISRTDLAKPFVQTWRVGTAGMSGVQGYATVIDRSPTTDPCADDGLSGTCSGAEVNHPGALNTNQAISDLPEGVDNFFHVATVSGAGVRSGVDHVQLKVDKTDPNVELGGVPQGYANEPVMLEADAVDALSGMQPSAEDPDDPPQTCIEVDGQATCVTGAESAVTIDANGVHTVRYWARDMAGNQPSPDQVQTTTVKVDLTLSDLEVAFNAKRRVRAGRKAKFSGLVRAPNAVLDSGKLVEIQVKVGKRWKTVGEAFRTQPDGTFAYSYRFRKFYTRPTRFKFRLKVVPEQGWPYEEAIYSPKRKIKVVPRKKKTR